MHVHGQGRLNERLKATATTEAFAETVAPRQSRRVRVTEDNAFEQQSWSQIATTSNRCMEQKNVTKARAIVHVGKIEQRILLVRGEKVIIDADLAEFYKLPTKRLNEQVKRNRDRFPEDFMFQLSKEEKNQVVASCDHLSKLKFSKVLPYAFTEHGALMAASVLNSKRAVEVSVLIVRAFVRLRRFIAEHKELSRRITQLENRLADHDQEILALFKAIKELISPDPPPKRRRIGFRPEEP